jgi:glycine dehydrogenase subunit 1
MDYVQITPEQRQKMLATIGVRSVEELYASLPDEFRLHQPLNLPEARSELELQRDLAALARRNKPASESTCFLGGGAYDHFIPSVVDAMAGQGAFVTAYTPYQAEASQGSLQAFFEFQTQVCRLTGLDVSNASLYDGATAAAEAVLMALNVTGKRRVLVAGTVHPDTRAVLRTYLRDLPATLVELPVSAQGVTDVAVLKKELEAGKGDTACVVVQSPNVLGLIEDWSGLFEVAKQRVEGASADGALAVALFNPMACGLLKNPGQCGADIAAGEGQPLGIPLQFGGPYLGLFAARQSLLRRMPGRLVGQTTDAKGNRGFCLTLQTREQHIRGAKATSNVCTNQGLLAVRATIYMTAMGPTGLREAATQCWHKAHHAASLIAKIPGYSLAFGGAFFDEFLVTCPVPAQKIIDAGREKGILPGLDAAKLGVGNNKQLLIAVTEKRSAAEIEALVKLLAGCV